MLHTNHVSSSCEQHRRYHVASFSAVFSLRQLVLSRHMTALFPGQPCDEDDSFASSVVRSALKLLCFSVAVIDDVVLLQQLRHHVLSSLSKLAPKQQVPHRSCFLLHLHTYLGFSDFPGNACAPCSCRRDLLVF